MERVTEFQSWPYSRMKKTPSFRDAANQTVAPGGVFSENRNLSLIGDGVGQARGGKSLEAQPAGGALAAGCLPGLVT